MESVTLIQANYNDLEKIVEKISNTEAENKKLKAALSTIIFDIKDVEKHFDIEAQTVRKYARNGDIECEERKSNGDYKFKLINLVNSDFQKLKRKLNDNL